MSDINVQGSKQPLLSKTNDSAKKGKTSQEFVALVKIMGVRTKGKKTVEPLDSQFIVNKDGEAVSREAMYGRGLILSDKGKKAGVEKKRGKPRRST